MFTVAQIQEAHSRVKTGADFPKYIQDIKALGVRSFETWTYDSHTVYYGDAAYSTSSAGMYPALEVSKATDKQRFAIQLKLHQEGKTDYPTFCQDCADTGVEKWIVDLQQMTCTYFDTSGAVVLTEKIPG